MKRLFLLVRGWYRLRRGYCPECNSSAPLTDTCPVCESWRPSLMNGPFPPDKATRGMWWDCFRIVHHIDKGPGRHHLWA